MNELDDIIWAYNELDEKGKKALAKFSHSLANIEHLKGMDFGLHLQCWFYRNRDVIPSIFSFLTGVVIYCIIRAVI